MPPNGDLRSYKCLLANNLGWQVNWVNKGQSPMCWFFSFPRKNNAVILSKEARPTLTKEEKIELAKT